VTDLIGFTASHPIEYSKSMYENISASHNSSFLQGNLSNLSWMEVANIFVLSTFIVRLPFIVKYFTDNRLNTGKARSFHADSKMRMLAPLLALVCKGITLYFANMGGLPAWSQMTPVNDRVARFGTFLAGLTLLSLVWIHCSISTSWSCCVSAQKKQKLSMRGAYQYARHPLYVNYLFQALSVFLISQNWLLGAINLPWVAYCFSRIKQEEVLMIELFGPSYVEYKQKVRAFGPFSRGKCDCGLTPNESQAALQLYNARQEEMQKEQQGELSKDK